MTSEIEQGVHPEKRAAQDFCRETLLTMMEANQLASLRIAFWTFRRAVVEERASRGLGPSEAVGHGTDEVTRQVAQQLEVLRLAWDIPVRAVLVPVYRYTVNGIPAYR